MFWNLSTYVFGNMNIIELDVPTSKICPKCGQSKPQPEFGKSACYCMECERIRGMDKYFRNKERYRINARNWRNNNKEKANAIARKYGKRLRAKCKALKDKITMANPCFHCKEHRIACLDFHHLDPTVKERPVAKCSSEKDLLNEASKCIVLCSNCHRLFHNGDIQLQNPVSLDVSQFYPIHQHILKY
jgi:hypothetical protein